MTTGAMAGFQSPEEAALELELPLLGTLPAPADESGPIAPSFPDVERARREYHRAADRILLSPLSHVGSVGFIGDVPSVPRARVVATLAASLAAEKTAILVDADLAGAHLSFDDRGRAQEGLVDVLRYGVRSPRVVAPTQAPGLNLLPVGSGTVDLAGTYGSESTAALFAELRRTGDLVIVNGPDAHDLATAGPFVEEIGAWVLVHAFGISDGNRTRELRDMLGHSVCVGVLAVQESALAPAPAPAAEAPAVARATEASIASGPAPEPEAAAAAREEPEPSVRAPEAVPPPPPSRASVPEPPPLPPQVPAERESEAPLGGGAPESDAGSFERTAAAADDAAGEETVPEEDWGPEDERRGPSKILVGVLAAASLAVVALFWFGTRDDGETPAGWEPRPAPLAGAPPAGTPDAARGETGAEGKETAAERGARPGADVAAGTGTGPAEGEGAQTPPAPSGPKVGAETPRSGARPPDRRQSAIDAKAAAGPEVSTGAKAAGPRAAVSATGAWGVHVTSMQSGDGAVREIALLEKAGYAAISREVDVATRGRWYRIYVGPYDTKGAARAVAQEIRDNGIRKYAQVQRLPVGDGTGREDR